jgi:NhaA family Na+:H+ antiporter
MSTPRGPWAHLTARLERFFQIEAASGVVLVAATAIALAWASSPWAAAYEALWHTPRVIELGSWRAAHDLQFWVNDGLMTIFFFVVGLEIRRDVHDGELRDLRRAALPILAALGGMLVPAAIYVALNAGRASLTGWAVPMATDIAFAVGVLALLGRRVPPALRILLLALAVIDDIGAIVVIAVWYSAGISVGGLAIVGAGLAAVVGMRALGVRAVVAYIAPGVVVWAGMSAAGIHPALAGVALGLLAPVGGEASPNARLQRALHRWVAFAILPVFALANAGVALTGVTFAGDGARVFLGIALGLAVGKPLGVLIACRLGARLAPVPPGALVLGLVAGIGFSMALFVAQLAFPPGPLLETAKAAILAGSLAAALAGLVVGRRLRAQAA